MDHNTYIAIVNKHLPKVPKYKKAIKAFLSGGFIGLSSQLLSTLLIKVFHLSSSNSYIWVGIILVLLTAILTGLGFFDNLFSYFEAGLIVPTTGFSHAVISGGLDGKKEGFVIGLAPSMFKLCAAVLISGVSASFIFSLIGWLIYG